MWAHGRIGDPYYFARIALLLLQDLRGLFRSIEILVCEIVPRDKARFSMAMDAMLNHPNAYGAYELFR